MTRTFSSASERLPMLDAGRFIAAAAIVWLHTWMDYPSNIAEAGRFSVPFFAAAAAYLMLQSLERRPNELFTDYAIKRIRRIYLPFLGWCVIYLAASEFKRRYVSHAGPFPLLWSLLWVGSSLQLWFLPFLLIASLTLFPFCKFMARKRPAMSFAMIWGIAFVLIALGLLIALEPFPWHGTGGFDTNLQATYILAILSWQTLPALFWGLALAVIGLPRRKMRAIFSFMGGIMLIAATGVVLIAGRNTLLENLSGIGALVFFLAPWDSPLIRLLAGWGSAAYGIYLAHVLFIEAMFAFVARRHIQNPIPLKLCEFITALLLSAVVVWALNRSKWTRWLNG